MKIQLSLLFVLGFIFTTVKANTLSGKLIHKKDRTPIAFANIQIAELEIWTISNKDGQFSFSDISLDKFTLHAHFLGMIDLHEAVSLKQSSDTFIVFEMIPKTFDMKEVTVVSELKDDITTTRKISAAAIEHVQSTSLADALQLLPGNLILNPNLNETQTIAIREIGNSPNSAVGTAIMVDGIPVHNDANFQTYSTTQFKTSNNSVSGRIANTAGTGIDLRQISTDNIQSIEVVQGIPSVTFGNLTSGAVEINTKSGVSPLELKAKSDTRIKQVYAGKGFSLAKGAVINANVDYTHSFKDIRSSYTSFERITGNVAYSQLFFKQSMPLSFKVNMAYYNTLNEIKTDPDAMAKDEYSKTSESGIRLGMRGSWLLNKAWIGNLEYNVSYSESRQENVEKMFRSSGIEKISLSNVAGENEGIYLPSESLTNLTIKGAPLSFFAQVVAKKTHSFKNKASNKFLYGFDYRMSGNHGEGRIYDISNPPWVDRNSSRPRSYNSIPFAKTFAVFLEDNYSQPFGKKRLDIQAGLRINNFQPQGLLKSEVGILAEPRLNARFTILENNTRLIKKIAIRGGVGYSFKSPSLLYLYPDKAYVDLVSLDYYTQNPNTQMAYFTTKVFDTSNPDLKPSKNLKKEIGVDIKIGSVSASITGFYEDLYDGFGMQNQYQFIDYRVFDKTQIAAGTQPNLETLPSATSTYIIAYSQPVNNKQTKKMGVEYSFNFGELKALHTKVLMNGAWLKTQRIYSTQAYDYLPSKTIDSFSAEALEYYEHNQYKEIGVYASGKGSVSERLNTTFRFVTHLTQLKMVFTNSLQVTWYEKMYNLPYQFEPLALYNQQGELTTFTSTMNQQPEYYDYVDVVGSNYFKAETLPPLLLFNFKLSKAISNNMEVSFNANNFFNYRPIYQYKRSNSFVRRNQIVYFGADLKIKL